LNSSVIVMALGAVALAPQVHAEQATPGYNNKIPEKIMTSDKVETPLGILDFFDGAPTKATVDKIYDNLDLMRGLRPS
jgi:hypothetical protein